MFPFTGLRLLLPALLPSWRFFDAVTASPRVDYALLASPAAAPWRWREFRPRPAVLTVGAMLRRLFWNAAWNEGLFVVSLAERLIGDPSPATQAHSERELLLRVARHLDRHAIATRDAWLLIRIRLVGRDGDELVSEIAWTSAPCRIATLVTP